MYIGRHVNNRFSCQTLMKLECSDRASKNNDTSTFMTIRPMRAELFHADGRTDGRRTDSHPRRS